MLPCSQQRLLPTCRVALRSGFLIYPGLCLLNAAYASCSDAVVRCKCLAPMHVVRNSLPILLQPGNHWVHAAAVMFLFYPVPRSSFLQALFGADFSYLIRFHRRVPAPGPSRLPSARILTFNSLYLPISLAGRNFMVLLSCGKRAADSIQ